MTSPFASLVRHSSDLPTEGGAMEEVVTPRIVKNAVIDQTAPVAIRVSRDSKELGTSTPSITPTETVHFRTVIDKIKLRGKTAAPLNLEALRQKIAKVA